MATQRENACRRELNTLFLVGATRELTDGQLLERFATGHGKVCELAFAALVDRHGAMVERVCRAQLGDSHDAQDAFQATFLILVRKARTLWVRDSLGPWLHQVAYRTSACARANHLRRQRHERRVAERFNEAVEHEIGADPEWGRVLHAEILRLPDRYRIPIVLCDLEGRTSEEAAREMNCPVGTVKSWRSRGRARLRQRLIRAGLSSTAALEVALMADAARAGIVERAAEITVRTAVRSLSPGTAAVEVSESVRRLIQGGLRPMLLNSLRNVATVGLAVALVAAGVVAVARVEPTDPGPKAEAPRPEPVAVVVPKASSAPAPAPRGEIWELSLRDAIGIALDNNETVRVLSLNRLNAKRALPNGGLAPGSAPDTPRYFGAIWRIGPSDSAPLLPRFRADVMGYLFSVEQAYWELAQADEMCSASEKAIALGEEIHRATEADLAKGSGTVADVAESRQRLEQFRFDLVTKISDRITVERQLRKVLGLPLGDNRRIVAVTPPVDAKVTADWDKSLAKMLANHPMLVSEVTVEDVRNALLSMRINVSPADLPPPVRASFDALPPGQKGLIHQATHSLARCVLELDAGYKQFETAKNLRSAADERLKAQRAFYDEGRITIDRYLDAVTQYANALGMEVKHRAIYTLSIAALEEAQGTLLEYNGIEVVAGRLGRRAKVTVTPAEAQAGSPAVAAPLGPQATHAANPLLQAKADEGAADMRTSKGYSFQLSIKIGPLPIEIRGSLKPDGEATGVQEPPAPPPLAAPSRN